MGQYLREYFGKSTFWLYLKFDGIDDNKQPTEFAIEERYHMKGVLCNLADRNRKAADSIE